MSCTTQHSGALRSAAVFLARNASGSINPAMHSHYTSEQWLPYPVDLVFAFFANPENLPRLMPQWQRARIDEATFRPPPPRPEAGRRFPGIAAGDGTSLTLSFRPIPFCPLRVKWLAAISHFVWNEQFCDTQVTGPFYFWHHCHKVTAERDPETNMMGTRLRDEIEFQLPLQPVSTLALPLARRHFDALFRLRHQRTAELLARASAR